MLRRLLIAVLVLPCLAAAAGVRQIQVPPTNDVASLAVSPDGRTLALVSRNRGRNHIWLQPLHGGEARPLAGTEEAVFPFWSPDGTQLGFFARDELRRVDVATGQVKTVTGGVAWPAGGSWAADGTILFASHGRYTLSWVDSADGSPQQLTQFSGSDTYAHVHPQFLADGIHFLFYVQGEPGVRGIHIGRLDRPGTYRLVDSEAAGAHANGRLYYLQQGTLHARMLDLATLSLEGEGQVLARDVPLGGRSVAALSAAGDHVVWRAGPAGSTRQLTWYDRSGNVLGTVGEPFLAGAGALSISPDGSKAVINHLVDGMGEIGVIDLVSGALTPVTRHPANDSYPIWSSDGAEVLFTSKRTQTYEMYRQKPGEADAVKVFDRTALRHPMDMSRDGRYLVFRSSNPDLRVFDERDEREILIIPSGAMQPKWPQLSPDGRWFAFESGTLRGKQVYLHGPIEPRSRGKTTAPISAGGGGWVRWRADGRELFYVHADGTLMAMPLAKGADGSPVPGQAVALFVPPMMSGPEDNGVAQQYAVAADGQRVLVIAAPEAASAVQVLGQR